MYKKTITSVLLYTVFFLLHRPDLTAQISTKTTAPFISLNSSSVDAFVDQAFSASKNMDARIRQEVHHAKNDTLIITSLIQQFHESRRHDFNRSLIILSLLGEMGAPQTIEFYKEILAEETEAPTNLPGEYLSSRDLLEMLQAKAIQSLAYIKSDFADSLVLHEVQWHPAVAVRSAGIDAYLFNHGDSQAARERLQQVLDQAAWIYLDRVRRKKSVVNKSIDEDLENFYNKYPDQLAPVHYSPRGTRVTNFLNFRSFLFLSVLFILVFLILRKLLRRDTTMRDYLSRHP